MQSVGPRTKKQADFLKYYLDTKAAAYNATKAAKMAGYSERTAYSIGSQLLKKPHIKAVVDVVSIMRQVDARRALMGAYWTEPRLAELVAEYLRQA